VVAVAVARFDWRGSSDKEWLRGRRFLDDWWEECKESERDFREDPPKVRKLVRLMRLEGGGDVWIGENRCTGVGDSPTPPVESILAKAVEDVAMVGRALRNAWDVGPRPGKPVVDVGGVGPAASVTAVIR
jgi:hypothetical protein